ncbi:MAG: hypothetical protein QNJ72_26245 [Pleurocapsa sp. MO_226.B13]|nr:hypothetical protein [Pleurocapsa sp. MO_226.B13]
MSSNDVELFQSFCRRYVNRQVRDHFSDVPGEDDDSLSRAVPRQLIKRLCLHKDRDNLVLTIARLLLWWIEAKGLFDEYIYGIPSTDFHISNTIYPQVKLHFREDKFEAANNTRRPARSEVSFRWREDDYSTTNVNQLVNKIVADFVNPLFFYKKGRTRYTYVDKQLGYYFQINADDETNARKIIEQVIRIQDDTEPDWENKFKTHIDDINYANPGTVRVLGETIRKPKKRPIATVRFAYAELFIPGLIKPIILVDRTGTKANGLRYV